MALAAGLALGQPAGAPAGVAQSPATPLSPAAQRGQTVFYMTGGCGCHTDSKQHGPSLAGGRPIKTPFGTIFSTNITPDAETGLGRWTEAEFARAMTQGLGKQGEPLYPVFPYTSFTRMQEQDVKDLWAYLQTVPAVRRADRPPALFPPFGWRWTLAGWRALFFRPGALAPDPALTPQQNRGAYLVRATGHCAECHTPRNLLGGLKRSLAYAGSLDGPEGALAPNITPDPHTGIGEWSGPDLTYFLKTGNLPDGDTAGGLMGEVIDQGYSHLSDEDIGAMAAYLHTLPAIEHRIVKKKKE